MNNSTPISPDADLANDHSRRVDRWLTWFVWIVAYAFVCGLILADPDLWGHTLYGLRAWEQGVLVEPTDPFSYTAPHAIWVNHEWLTELQFAWIWTSFGNVGLWMWRNLLVLLIFVCVAIELRRQRANLAASTVLLLYGAACLSQFVIFARPQVPTHALFALTLTLLKRYSEGATRLQIWLLPPLMILWTNLHGGFLAGCGIIAVYTVADVVVRFHHGWKWTRESLTLPVVAGLCAIGTFCNPYGYHLHLMLWEHLATDQFVVEWQPLWAARQAPTYYVPLVILALALPASRCWTWTDAAILAVVGSQALSHIRHVSLLAIACLILLPGPLSEGLPAIFRHFSHWLQQPGRLVWRIGCVGLVAGILLVLQIRGTVNMWQQGSRPWDVAVESRSPVPGMPIRAVTFLKREKVSGNLLTDYGWAQFVFWHAPQFKLAFDGRYRTVYSSKLESEFLAFQRSGRERPVQTAMLDKYPTEVVMLPIASGAAGYLTQRKDFLEIYRDDQAVIWVRTIPRFVPLTQKFKSGLLAPVDAPRWQPFPGNTGD